MIGLLRSELTRIREQLYCEMNSLVAAPMVGVGSSEGNLDGSPNPMDAVGPAVQPGASPHPQPSPSAPPGPLFLPLPSGPSRGVIELTPKHGPRLLDVSRDVSSLLWQPMAPLVVRLRWLLVVIGILGAAASTLAVFVVHWATGGAGQFALAYQWPWWLEVWFCVGWWTMGFVLLMMYGSLQREVAWMALTLVSTWWIIAMTAVFVAGLVSLYEFGVHRSTWVGLPSYIGCALFFPLIAMADALPPGLRVPVLRIGGPFALGSAASAAMVLRLPTAERTPGELVWSAMGTDTVTNLHAITYSTTVLAVLLAEGTLRAWVFPRELAFITMSVRSAYRSGAPGVATVHPLPIPT